MGTARESQDQARVWMLEGIVHLGPESVSLEMPPILWTNLPKAMHLGSGRPWFEPSRQTSESTCFTMRLEYFSGIKIRTGRDPRNYPVQMPTFWMGKQNKKHEGIALAS